MPEDRNEISRRILSALRYQMSLEEDAQYECAAWTDGEEGFRALAYTTVGFSRPVLADPGNNQFISIKNGRVDAETTRQALTHYESQFDVDEIDAQRFDRTWQSTVEQINRQRRLRRAEQRNTAQLN